MKPRLLVLVIALISPTISFAELSMPKFFSDHMVLQRERSASIWGDADPNAEVTVSFKGKTAKTHANAQGSWRLGIETGPADAIGEVLTVTSGNDSLAIKDVLVGEVWFASGQSNMVFTMNRVPAYEALIAESHHPGIRMFNAPLVTAVEPQDDIEGVWTMCDPSTVPTYSAIAFFFARKLHQELGVPIGVIKSAWGGKPVETFTSREALQTLPGTKALVDEVVKADANFDARRVERAYQARLEQWKANSQVPQKKPVADRRRVVKKPAPPKRPLDTEGNPGVLFDAMINPFVGYTMQGVIWYQGEGNAKPGAVPYDQTLPLMIRDWRRRWNDEFSFYFVQLANFRQPSTEPGTPDHWALLQDRMRLILDTTPKTGMAIINEVGEVADIHPKNKKDPGERLARWALAKDYGRDIVYSGPLYQSSEAPSSAAKSRYIVITFDHAGSGLKSRDGGSLKRFEIAGKDRVWHWAEATIDGANRVKVSSKNVPAPVAVRYAWASNPAGANLVNSEGLPASIFRTDDWDDFEAITQQPPNVLFIIADDASRHFGESYDCDWVKTPNIDRLAREGLVFENAYVPTSKCAPCRAAILTGRNPWQNGQAANHQNHFPSELPTFSEWLRTSGFHTGSMGKVWGPGRAVDGKGEPRDFALPPGKTQGKKQPGVGFSSFLADASDGKAFFYWHGSHDPHRPYDKNAGQAAGKKVTDIDHVPTYWPDNDVVRNDMLDYATEVERFDSHVGELLKILDESNAADNTLVIVTSDHGMPFPRVKGHTYDDAHHVPMVMRWPKGIVNAGRRVAEPVSVIDLAPTFLELAGIDASVSAMDLTGTSLVDLLKDAPTQKRPFVLIGRERNDVYARPGSESGLGYPVRGIRKGDYLFIHNFKHERWPCGNPELGLKDTDASPTKSLIESLGIDDQFWQQAFGKRSAEQLFDVTKDSDCVTNLMGSLQFASVVKDLRQTLMTELKRQKDPRIVGDGDAFDHYPTIKPAPREWNPDAKSGE